MSELFKYSYRILTLDLTPGLVDFEVPIDGQKIVYAGPVDGPTISIRLQSKSNDQIPLRPQGTIRAPYQRLYISAGAVASSIQLLIASPDDIDLDSRDVNVNTIATVTNIGTLGTITNPVIAKPYELDRAIASQIFERADTRSSAAGQRLHYQIKNPAASGKTVILLSSMFVGASDIRSIYQHNTDLATLIGTLYNVNSGGAASVAQLRTESNASILGTNLLAIWRANILQTPPQMHRVDVLGAGEGIVFIADSLATSEAFSARILEF